MPESAIYRLFSSYYKDEAKLGTFYIGCFNHSTMAYQASQSKLFKDYPVQWGQTWDHLFTLFQAAP